jgi:hypothetical protein
MITLLDKKTNWVTNTLFEQWFPNHEFPTEIRLNAQGRICLEIQQQIKQAL